MPKRPCPFVDEEDYARQQKVHIGEKEVDNGVLSQDKMKAVYDKTLSLLYRGAKNIMNNNAEVMECSSIVQKDAKSNLQQMVLTTKGTLVKPVQSVNIPAGISRGSNICVSCKTVATFTRPRCAYCECTLCERCVRTCHFCKGDFCNKCSLTIYLQEERVVCSSCC